MTTTGDSASTDPFWAFIGYSSQDAEHARWLQRAIETYDVPARLVEHDHLTPVGEPAPTRFRPIFCDRAEPPGSADLGAAAADALAGSRYLIVICSPHAAGSRRVNREIEAFVALGRRDRIFAYIVDGQPYSGDERECFPPALRSIEPLAADARWQGRGRADALLKLLAGMLGVSFDVLEHYADQRRIRRYQQALAGAALLVLAFAVLASYADQQRLQIIQTLEPMGATLEFRGLAAQGIAPTLLLVFALGMVAQAAIGSLVRRFRRRAHQRQRQNARRTRFNPYVVGAPITEEAGFFGRRAELERIMAALPNNHILISGERRIGKTSLLRQVEIRARETGLAPGDYRLWPVRLSLQGVPAERFYAGLMRAVLKQTHLSENGRAVARRGQPYDDRGLEEDLRWVIAQLVQRRQPARQQVRLVLCLDELDTLTTYPPAFRQQLRAVIQELEPAVRLAAAGVMTTEQEATRTSPFYNLFMRVQLAALTRAEAEQLIREPVAGVYSVSDAAVAFILDRSHRLPQEVQRLCHHAINVMLDQNAANIDLAQAERAFDRALDDRTPEFQLAWWGGQSLETGEAMPPFSAVQRDALRRALASGGLLARPAYEGETAVFRRHQLYNVTCESSDDLRLTALFAAWMEKNKP